VPSKAALAELAANGGASTLPTAPNGSAERVADPHEGEDITRPDRDSTILLNHAFHGQGVKQNGVTEPWDICADCGWPRSDHNPDYGKDAPEPGDMTITDYDAKGEAIDREVGPKPTAQPTLPGVPSASIWGDYQGHRLSHVQLAFGGGPDAPRDLAGKLNIGARIHLLVTGCVASNGYQQDKDLIYFGKVRVKLDAVTVPGKRFVEEAEAMTITPPPAFVHKSVVADLVKRAFEDDGKPATDEGAESEPSPLSAALAEAMAEA